MRRSLALLPLLFAVLVFTGCDSDSLTGGDANVTIQGQVSDDNGFGKTAAAIEGAIVTAATVQSDGSLRALSGEATTTASGNFSLDIEETADVVVLTAQKANFDSKVLVATESRTRGTVRAMPMTVETQAEAEVFVEIRAEDQNDSDRATAADVALFVNQQLALAIENGSTTAVEIAAAIRAAARAEAEYIDEADDAPDDANDEVERRELAAFAQLQADLSVASTTQAEAEALSTFQSNLVAAYTAANVSLETQARARQSGEAALIRFSAMSSSETRFALRKQATIITSLATALAVESRFEAEGAADSRIQALAEARATLLAELRAASSQTAMSSARASYESSVKAELQSELNVNAVVLTAAEASLMPVKATLDASVGSAASADAVATAYATFFTTAQTTAETALSSSAKASLGASVLALLTVQ